MKKYFQIPFALLLSLSCLPLSSCISSKSLNITSYSFTVPSIAKTAKEPRFGNLFVQDFYVNPTFEDKNFIYQTGDLTYESDFYNQLKLSPRAQFTTLTRAALNESNLFKSVIMPESFQNPEYRLEGNITKFYVDFRNPKNPKANLSVTFRFYFIPPDNRTYQLLLAKTYEESIPVATKSADSIAHSWDAAYGNIMRQFVRHLEKLPVPDKAP